MKKIHVILILMLLPFLGNAQSFYLGFCLGRDSDTAKTNGSLLVPKYVRLPQYGTNDTDKVLGVNSAGLLVLRTKGNGSGTTIDTAAMLVPYLRSAVAASTYQPIGTYLTSETDPTFNTKFAAKSTTDLAEGTNKYYTDVKVSAVIDADTGRGPNNLVTGGGLGKVKDSLGALIGGGGVSVASVAEVNTGTDNTKFASPLAIQGSKYLDQSGVKVYATTGGVANTYTLTLSPAISAYTAGLSLWVKFHAANTGSATINVNGLGAKTLVKDVSTALVANDIPINQWYTLVYNGTYFLIQDIGFGGVNLSARLSGALSDETGTGVAVFSASPTFTGVPAAPTASAGTSTTQLATTAFVTTADNLKANLASPTFTGVPAAPTAAAATNTTQLATTAHVFAERTNTATLTNKTLTSPSIATPLVTGLSSGTTNDSLLVADATTGAVKRISSARIAGGGGGGTDAAAWHKGGDATGANQTVGTTDAYRFGIIADNRLKTFSPIGYSVSQPALGTTTGAAFVVNTGLDDQVRFGAIMGADENGRFYFQSQNHSTSFAYPASFNARGGSVDIGTLTSVTSVKFQVAGTDGGALICPMTTTTQNALPGVTNGVSVFNTDLKRPTWYDGTAWRYSAKVFTGTAAPSTTPEAVGDTFIDTVNKKSYAATGTSSSADWTILN